MFAIIVRANQRPDQQHRRTGRAHQAGQQRAQREDAGVHAGTAVQVALDTDAARNDIQRGQQYDKRNEFVDDDMDCGAKRNRSSKQKGTRQQECGATECRDLAVMPVPESRHKQWRDCNRQQQCGKRQCPPGRQAGARQLRCLTASRPQGRGNQHRFFCTVTPTINAGTVAMSRRAPAECVMRGKMRICLCRFCIKQVCENSLNVLKYKALRRASQAVCN